MLGCNTSPCIRGSSLLPCPDLSRLCKPQCFAPRSRQYRKVSATAGVRLASVVRTQTSGTIRYGSYLSRKSVLEEAVNDCVSNISKDTKPGSGATLALVFASSFFGPDFDAVVPLLRAKVPTLRHIIGCSGFAILGSSKAGTTEVDSAHGLSITLADMPGVDISVKHTLRGSIPDTDDASSKEWAEFVGLPEVDGKDARNVSFLIFADSRFSQVRDIMEGLDYYYPRAAKLGGLLSVGVKSKERGMWAWSADAAKGSVASMAAGPSSSNSKQVPGQPSPSARISSTVSSSGSSSSSLAAADDLRKASGAQASTSASTSSARTSLLATSASSALPQLQVAVCKLLSQAVTKLGITVPPAVEKAFAGLHSQQPADGQTISQPSALSQAGRAQKGRRDDASSQDPQDANDSTGLHLYGAVMLAMHGDVRLETIVSRGYRAPSSTVWRIEASTPAGDDTTAVIAISEASPPAAERSASGSEKGGPVMRITISTVEDDDSEDEEEGRSIDVPGGQPALSSILDMVQSLGDAVAWEDLMEEAVMAVAADSSKALEDLGPSDWEMLEIKNVDQESGSILIGGEVRRGYRMRLMIRDEQGMCDDLRQQLLQYKKDDLAATLRGDALPPAFGAIVMSDVERIKSARLKGRDSPPDSDIIASYLPVPTAGVFGGAQLAPLPGGADLLEYSCVVGVLRATNAAPSLSSMGEDGDTNTSGADSP